MTHFNHKNIIEHCNRPFKNVEEMNEALIDNWNSAVGKKDTVYHLGDFAFSDHEDFFKRLNGQKHLIIGNHDKGVPRHLFLSYRHLFTLKHLGIKTVLCHYAMKSWEYSFHGSYHLYGHSHGNMPEDENSLSFDIGVDSWNYAPVSFEQVLAKMATKEKYWKPIG